MKWVSARLGPVRRAPAILGGIFLLVSGFHLVWILKDQGRMIKPDCYIYLRNLLLFIDDFSLRDLPASIDQLNTGGRPPLYQLLTTPFILLFGRSEDALLAVNFLFLFVLVVATYNICRVAVSAKAGLLAAFLVATYSPVIHLFRAYLPHAALPACFALNIWSSLVLLERKSTRSAWFYGATLALGLLVHPRFVSVAAVPAVTCGIYLLISVARAGPWEGSSRVGSWVWGRFREPLVIRGLVPALLMAVLPAAIWYVTQGDFLFKTIEDVSSSGVARSVGYLGVPHGFWFFARTAPAAMSNFFVLIAAIGLLAALFKRDLASRFLAITFAGGYVVSSSNWFLVWWNFAALLPVAACLSAIWIVGLRSRWLSGALAFACLAIGTFIFSVVSFGAQPWGRDMARALGSPLADGKTCENVYSTAFCPSPPQSDLWPVAEVLQEIVDDPECSTAKPCRVLVVDYLLSTRDAPGFWFRRVGYFVTSLGLGQRIHVLYQDRFNLRLRSLLESEYVLYPDVSLSRRTPFSYYQAIIKFLQDPSTRFGETHEAVATFAGVGGEARLLKRTGPLTPGLAEEFFRDVKVYQERYYRPRPAGIVPLPEDEELGRRYRLQKEQVLSSLNASEIRATCNPRALEELVGKVADVNRRVVAGLRLADSCLSMGTPGQALFLYLEILSWAPRDYRAHLGVARVFSEMGEPAKALPHFESAVEFAPARRRAFLLLRAANLLLSFGELDRAIEKYRQSLELSDDLRAHLGLAEAHRGSGETAESLAVLESARRLVVSGTAPDLMMRMANDFRALGELDQAEALYRQVLEVEPDRFAALDALGRLKR